MLNNNTVLTCTEAIINIKRQCKHINIGNVNYLCLSLNIYPAKKKLFLINFLRYFSGPLY